MYSFIFSFFQSQFLYIYLSIYLSVCVWGGTNTQAICIFNIYSTYFWQIYIYIYIYMPEKYVFI